MLSSPRPPGPMQLAVEQANAAIRAYLRTLPRRRPETEAEHEEYGRLVEVFMAAVTARDGARRRESEDPPARAA